MAYEIKDPDAPATRKQTWAIFTMGGGDVRDDDLSRQQASDIIGKLKSNKSNKSRPTRKCPADYEAILAEATEAANTAGDAWCANARPMFKVVQRANPLDDTSPITKTYDDVMLDVCGIVYLSWRDRRVAFYKWCLRHNNNHNWDRLISLRIPHNYVMRQEMGLGEATCRAALDVLEKHNLANGITLYSRID